MEDKQATIRVVGVRFKEVGKIYYFDPMDIEIRAGEHVIVETARGMEFGDVVVGPREVDERNVVLPLKKIVRKATEEDRQQLEENQADERDALKICQGKIQEHRLPMKLINVEYTFDRSKAIFYFTAEGRVDFRNLVKDLAGIFRTRIELRQIGVRDEAKMVGGLGSCGRELCCCTFLGDFETVSIKMAKEQNLSLNPTKISGICGRLMCCLKYENEVYEKAKAHMPREGSRVRTPLGVGRVTSANVIQEIVAVRFADDKQEIFEVAEVQRAEPDTPLDVLEPDMRDRLREQKLRAEKQAEDDEYLKMMQRTGRTVSGEPEAEEVRTPEKLPEEGRSRERDRNRSRKPKNRDRDRDKNRDAAGEGTRTGENRERPRKNPDKKKQEQPKRPEEGTADREKTGEEVKKRRRRNRRPRKPRNPGEGGAPSGADGTQS